MHDVCEIYVNVSGNVSFLVENSIYPISRGSVVITKPNEYHQCIYHRHCIHEHFWILFPVNGNEHFFSRFLHRENGTGNLISLSDPKREEFLSLCYRMEKSKSSDPAKAFIEQYSIWMQILLLLNDSTEAENNENAGNAVYPFHDHLPKELTSVINYINENFATIKTIQELSARFFICQSTFGRLFRRHLHISPYNYLENKRLIHAKMLLQSGKSVLSACLESGFSDCSHFIATFKKRYGMTPLQYKKANQGRQDLSSPVKSVFY